MKIGKTRPSDTFSKALAHYTIGVIYDNEGKTRQAREEYKKALELDPKISYLHTRLGVDYFLGKKTDQAVEEFKTAQALDPLDTKPRFLLALAYTAQNKFDLAQKEYEGVVRINPNDIAALGSLADLPDEGGRTGWGAGSATAVVDGGGIGVKGVASRWCMAV